ncbi:MAG: fibronectin type III domain-containing protein [Lachnospiraceae bacterium]|nr:fibronectin type III domain-containing protein [Lachnospiraceae bacterium]
MKNNIKRLLCGAIAAVVLVTSASSATPVFAANSAKTATAATPEQEVVVKKPAKQTVTASSDTIKVTIKKVAGATGYQVQYATNKKMTSGKKTISTKKTTYKVSKLKANKTYYVRVRSYKIVNGKKVYSKWTTVEKVKTKK